MLILDRRHLRLAKSFHAAWQARLRPTALRLQKHIRPDTELGVYAGNFM